MDMLQIGALVLLGRLVEAVCGVSKVALILHLRHCDKVGHLPNCPMWPKKIIKTKSEFFLHPPFSEVLTPVAIYEKI